jgi:hypothetical protein
MKPLGAASASLLTAASLSDRLDRSPFLTFGIDSILPLFTSRRLFHPPPWATRCFERECPVDALLGEPPGDEKHPPRRSIPSRPEVATRAAPTSNGARAKALILTPEANPGCCPRFAFIPKNRRPLQFPNEYRRTGAGIGESAPFTLLQIISFNSCAGLRSTSEKSMCFDRIAP